jgi:choline dehydrogenase-like flavoprotein
VVGGGSIFFGGAVLRLRETDFDKWPIDYADLEPYYSRAESLLEIYGDVREDPCDPHRSQYCILNSIPLTAPAQRVYEAAFELGYQPFKLPIAINFRDNSRPVCPGCNTCDGYPCKIEAKNDLTINMLKKANDFGSEILANTLALRIHESGGEVLKVECIDKQKHKTFYISPKVVIVSGGALQSPALLLRSNLTRFEHIRFVGKYLMRHCNAVVCSLFPFKTNPDESFHKQVAISSFYEDLREKLQTSTGMIQDIYTPQREAIEHLAPRGMKRFCGLLSGHVQNLICIAEDDPNFENAVSLSDELDAFKLPMISVNHKYSKDDHTRRDYLVRRAKRIMRKAGALCHYVVPVETFSHAVGTIRFGTNPDKSPLDRNCQFFGVRNLFVVDGSFFPTSGGVNPSLTIGANALRVAEHIKSELVHEGP